MLKLIIADDEEIIRETISELIDWSSLGIRLVGLCSDGIQAYHMILDEMPDIVLLDIKMPGLSGLELIEKIRQTDSTTQFILLSGYGEFEYAKKAMRYGVHHYLLKPCNEAQIIESIRMASRESLHQKAFRQMHRQQFLSETLHNSIMTTLIADGISVTEPIHDLYDSYQNYFDFKNTGYELSFFYFLEKPDLAKCLSILKEFQTQYSPSITYYGVYVKNTLLIYFENCLESYDIFDEFCSNIEIVGAAVSMEYQRVHYFRLADLLNDLFVKIRRYQTVYCINNFRIIPVYNYGLSTQISDMTEKLLRAESSQSQNLVEELRSILSGIENIDYLKQVCSNILLQCSTNCLPSSPVSLTETLLELNQQTDFGAITDLVCQKVLELFNARHHKGQYTAPIEEILRYVDEHIDNPALTLKWIAENHLYMNVDYISKRFLKETGIKFSQYLSDARIAKAKSLLAREHMIKIACVAEQVGCGNNPQYFSQIFKKHTGYTPSEYVHHLQSF